MRPEEEKEEGGGVVSYLWQVFFFPRTGARGGRYIIAKLRLHGTDNTAGVKQLVDLQPLALVVDDIAVVLRVGVVGDEVLLDEDHEGLLDDFGVELDVVADLGDGQTAELEEDRDDFLERVSCVLLQESRQRGRERDREGQRGTERDRERGTERGLTDETSP